MSRLPVLQRIALKSRDGGRATIGMHGNLVYCPYTDREIPRSKASPEHVIPLALGGHDDLVIPVDARANSSLGSAIDGAMANEFFVARRRVKYDVRGHSRRKPSVVLKQVQDSTTHRPLQVRWGKRFEVYDVVEQRYRPEAMEIGISISLDLDIRLRFLAKAFLAGGYLTYGDLFRSSVDHGEARLLMRGPGRLADSELASMRTRIFEWFNTDLSPEQGEEFGVQQGICSTVKGSLLVFVPSRKYLRVFGGILGEYLGMLNVPADTANFPRSDDHDLGHAMVVSNGHVLHWPYRRLLGRMLQELECRRASETRAP